MNKFYKLFNLLLVCLLSFNMNGVLLVYATNVDDDIVTPGTQLLTEDNLIFSTTDPTNGSVTVTIVTGANAFITNDSNVVGQSNIYVFEENGSHGFEFEMISNGYTGVVLAVVDNINKEPPTLEIEYVANYPGNGNVIATVSSSDKDITVTNNDGLYSYTFSQNDDFEFEVIDQYGNTNSIIASVSNIDRVLPTASLVYSTIEETEESVTVTLTDFSKEITILNNDGLDTYTFTENGSFTFEFMDLSGNTNGITATVTWIVEPVDEEIIPNDDVVNTGDNTNVLVVLIGLVVSMVCIGGSLYLNSKNKSLKK